MNVPSRYAKQARFVGIGEAGQAALAAGRVLVVGCGATGGAIAETLARAGVGFLRIVDRDFVERSNLQRQVLFTEADAAVPLPKAVAAANRLRAINSEIEIEPVVADVTADNVLRLADGCGLMLDGTDNFETRFLLNDAALETGTPWVYSGVVGSGGQTMAVLPGRSACLRCVIDGPPDPGAAETCDTAGVIGPAVNAVAAMAAATALKLLIGRADLVPPRLTLLDVWDGSFRQIDTTRLFERGCPACRGGERAWLHGSAGSRTATLCGRNAVQVTPAASDGIDLAALAERLAASYAVRATPYLLRISATEPACEVTVFRDGRAIVQGTDDPAVARSLYARLVGS